MIGHHLDGGVVHLIRLIQPVLLAQLVAESHARVGHSRESLVSVKRIGQRLFVEVDSPREVA